MTIRLSTATQNKLAGKWDNLVTNGEFESAATSWTASNATLTGGVASGQSGNCMSVAESSGTAPGYAYQTLTAADIKIGQLYMVEAYFKKASSATGSIKVGNAANDATYYTSGTLSDASWTRYRGIFAPTTTAVVITLSALGEADTVYFDCVKIYNLSRSLQDQFNGAQFELYSGTQPADPDDVPSGTKLVTIKSGSNGVTWKDATDGVNGKTTTETWSGVVATSGTAGWFRLCLANDLGTDNTTDVRLDGSVGTSGADLNFSSVAFTVGATQTISDFVLTVPMEE